MLQIHPNARTTSVTRAEIARSTEPSGTLAKRYGVSAETIRKWRKRGTPSARTGPPARIACPGRPRTKSELSSAPCGKARTFRSTI